MRNLALIATIALISGCATPKVEELDGCNGRDIRPANPYGVTLPGIPQPEQEASSDPVEVFPEPDEPEPSPGVGVPIEVPAIAPQAALAPTYRSC